MATMCPNCRRPTLRQWNREGVLVYQCPECGGLWLDRGELEVLVGKARRRFPPVTVVAAEDGRRRPRWLTALWNLFGRAADAPLTAGAHR